jgi:hypothetical protein
VRRRQRLQQKLSRDENASRIASARATTGLAGIVGTMEHAAAWAPCTLRLGSEFFIEANQEQEKLRTLQVNMAHLNGL